MGRVKVECDDGLWWWRHQSCSLIDGHTQYGGPISLDWAPTFEGALKHIEKHQKEES